MRLKDVWVLIPISLLPVIITDFFYSEMGCFPLINGFNISSKLALVLVTHRFFENVK